MRGTVWLNEATATSFITSDAADYFGLPRERTVIMGSQIEV
ncbi:hypothetical protein [Nocardia carnea]|nr:hypothetical protein [Nocardia carnea]